MKTITMTGPKQAFRQLSKVIEHYAEAAYPPGGSDCAQSARAALLDTAEKIIAQLNNDPSEVVVSRRIKTHLKAAIQYDLQLSGEQDEEQGVANQRYELFLKLINGEIVESADGV
ncbi:MAG: hypothetical protein PVF28_07435 [Thioalkalispiraceae bacterium]|jgi:hypothetical protein